MIVAQKGLKVSCIHPFGHQKWTVIIFGKPLSLSMFEPFVVPSWPILKAFSGLRGAQIAQYGFKIRSFHLFVHPKESKSLQNRLPQAEISPKKLVLAFHLVQDYFGKSHFFVPGGSY